MQTNHHMRGIIYASLAAILWGMTGITSQYLFQAGGVNVAWMMGVKMFLASITLLIIAYSKEKNTIFDIFHSIKDVFSLVVFSLFGMAGVQFTYSMTVHHSNATIATILQTLGVILVIFYSAVIFKQWPKRQEWIAVITALVGAWFLITKGSLTSLALSPITLIWGIFLMITQMGNSVLPINLLKKYSSEVVSGWAMLVGGIVFEFIHPVWVDIPAFTLLNVSNMLFLIFIGTALAYYLFVLSLESISSTEATLLDTFEPLTAAILDLTIMNMTFNWAEYLGSFLVICTVFILAYQPKNKKM